MKKEEPVAVSYTHLGRNKYVIKTIPNIGHKSLNLKLSNNCIKTKITIIIVMQVLLRLKMINVQHIQTE